MDYYKTQSGNKLTGKALSVLIEATTERGASLRFCAFGYSMYPFIKSGDIITISPCIKPKIGQIAAFKTESSELTVHRIIGKNNGGVICKGDNNQAEDGIIDNKAILGVVTSIERNKKKVQLSVGFLSRSIAFLSKMGLLYFCTRIFIYLRNKLNIK